MKKKLYSVAALVLAILLCATCFAACAEESKNDRGYWFSAYSTDFVAYDDTDNIADAGTYWNFTVKNNCTVTLSVRANVDYFSGLTLKLNDNAVTGTDDEGIYSVVYHNLSLKKGDKLKLHAYWINRVQTNDEGFEIALFSIADGTGDYPISDVK